MYTKYTEDQLIRSAYFQIPGPCQAKERPRFSSLTNRAYTPDATRTYERKVIDCYRAKYGDKMLAGSIKIKVIVHVARPENATDEQWELMRTHQLYPTSVGGDCDNFLKSIADGLNSVAKTDTRREKRGAYPDDNLICDAHVIKQYDDGDPYTEVWLESLNQSLWLRMVNKARNVVFRATRGSMSGSGGSR